MRVHSWRFNVFWQGDTGEVGFSGVATGTGIGPHGETGSFGFGSDTSGGGGGQGGVSSRGGYGGVGGASSGSAGGVAGGGPGGTSGAAAFGGGAQGIANAIAAHGGNAVSPSVFHSFNNLSALNGIGLGDRGSAITSLGEARGMNPLSQNLLNLAGQISTDVPGGVLGRRGTGLGQHAVNAGFGIGGPGSTGGLNAASQISLSDLVHALLTSGPATGTVGAGQVGLGTAQDIAGIFGQGTQSNMGFPAAALAHNPDNTYGVAGSTPGASIGQATIGTNDPGQQISVVSDQLAKLTPAQVQLVANMVTNNPNISVQKAIQIASQPSFGEGEGQPTSPFRGSARRPPGDAGNRY